MSAADGGAAALLIAGLGTGGTDVMYEDDLTDNSIPDIQKITKKNNILPLWGNTQTMNLNALVLENIIQCTYYKNYLSETTGFQQLTEEIYYSVKHLEPWERGTRKTQGMTGMCGGVRGVGAGGVVSTAFCLLYKLFTIRLSRKQLVSMINNSDSPYIRGIGFMYIRFCQPPQDLWAWMEPYLDDEEQIDPRSGGGDVMVMAQVVKMMLTKLDWYGTLFPRIPVPIQKEIELKFREKAKLDYQREHGEREGDHDRHRSRSRSRDRLRERSKDRDRDRDQERSRERADQGKSLAQDPITQMTRGGSMVVINISVNIICGITIVANIRNIMSDAGNWCLIESDPGVFTELVRGFGVSGVQVEELYSLDEQLFSDLKPVHGLIFLFKWRAGEEPCGSLVLDNNRVFFAQQVIQNACATQAIINLLLNTKAESGIVLGPILEEFKSFTQNFDPMNRGLCLGNSEPIRKVHNSFSRQHLFELDIKAPEKEDNYHFITYVPVDGHIYELDGLREAPLDLGAVREGEDWLDAVRPIINARIRKYSAGEIHFNLMAVISDRKMKYQKRLTELAESAMETDGKVEEMNHLQALIAAEEEKEKSFKAENIRRRHNYIPFIVELLKVLAKEGRLVSLVQEAQEKANRKAAEKKPEKSKVKI
ncbi:Ubiquitin carboxyl-terminal hydrolase isozyme L5 [Dirofilaria immitis]|nr:Ubiquitin carboxyl-terminal hydrolase isozyme L5 [Dirofilaria immitis]